MSEATVRKARCECPGHGRWQYSVHAGLTAMGWAATWREAFDAACAELRKQAES